MNVREYISDRYESFLGFSNAQKSKYPRPAEASELVSFLVEKLLREEERFEKMLIERGPKGVDAWCFNFLRSNWKWTKKVKSNFWGEMLGCNNSPHFEYEERDLAEEETVNTESSESSLSFLNLAIDYLPIHERVIYREYFVKEMKITEINQKYKVSSKFIAAVLKNIKLKLNESRKLYLRNDPDWENCLRKSHLDSSRTSSAINKVSRPLS